MAKNGFKVMDSDMHVIEPGGLWERYIDPAFKSRAPKGLTRYQGDMQMIIPGIKPAHWPSDEWEKAKAAEQDDIYRDSYRNDWDSPSQVRAMDREGIDVAILYPSRGLYVLDVDGMDPGLGASIARAYNDWMRDFCSVAPNRLYGAAMASPFDVESAITEAQRASKETWFKAVFIRPNIVNGRNWYDRSYDPLWAEVQSLGVPLGFHEGAYVYTLPQVGSKFDTYMMHHTCCHSMEMMLAVVSFIGGGILERFPSLKVGFLEGNCSWVPWLVWRLNGHYELSGKYESPELKLEPMEYFQRQCYVSIDADEEPGKFVEKFGLIDNVVFSTDYPHNDAKYPHAIDTFLKMPFSQRSRRKILWNNCARMYGFN